MIISTYSNQFTLLLKGVDLLLKHEDHFHVTPGGLSDTFIEGLYETYSLAFDVTVSLDELKALRPATGAELTMTDYAAFLVKTLDNDDAYKLLNYYTVQFVKAAVETAMDDKREEVMGFLESVDITPTMLQSVEDEYNQFKEAKKTKTTTIDTKVLDNPTKVPYSNSMVDTVGSFKDELSAIQTQLTEILMKAIEAGTIEVEESQEAARFILLETEKITEMSQVTPFVQALGQKWPIFSGYSNAEKAKHTETTEAKDQMDKIRAQLAQLAV